MSVRMRACVRVCEAPGGGGEQITTVGANKVLLQVRVSEVLETAINLAVPEILVEEPPHPRHEWCIYQLRERGGGNWSKERRQSTGGELVWMAQI